MRISPQDRTTLRLHLHMHMHLHLPLPALASQPLAVVPVAMVSRLSSCPNPSLSMSLTPKNRESSRVQNQNSVLTQLLRNKKHTLQEIVFPPGVVRGAPCWGRRGRGPWPPSTALCPSGWGPSSCPSESDYSASVPLVIELTGSTPWESNHWSILQSYSSSENNCLSFGL